MNFSVINPLLESRWNTWLSEFSAATPFHTSQWARVLVDSYRYRLHYAVLRDGEHILALLPMAEVSSILTGRRGVSVPFADECRPLLKEGVPAGDLLDAMKAVGLERGWGSLELRGEAQDGGCAPESAQFITHYLTLEDREDQQLKRIKSAQRRNVRKACRNGVEVRNLSTLEAMDAYYALHCVTRKRQGAPPQPRRFFQAIHEHMIGSGQGFVLLARFQERWIAGAVYLHFEHNAVYKFGASDRSFQHLRANSLLMYEGIRHLRGLGIRRLSLGRTEPGNAGLLRFKRSWGAEESPLGYHRIGLGKNVCPAPAGSNGWIHAGSRVLRHAPIPVLRLLGNVLYRHLG